MSKAILNERFGRLLNEGISSVATRQEKTKAAIEQEIGEQFGGTIHMVQRWQKGHVPTSPEKVAFLVRYCVKRGRVGRDWATSFLSQARYDNRDTLLTELFPEVDNERTPVNRVYQNLPPRYGDFLGRVADINRLLEGLASRWPVISIEGMGGMGKTTLAVEAACRSLVGDSPTLDAPFAAIVWVSAKDKPDQKKWLNEVLDTIARVLDYPYITQLVADEKRREVDNLLRAKRTLVIVDNYETIEDYALEQWILHIPEPSKVLMTTRYGQLRSVWAFHLNGLKQGEALQLIRNQLRRLGLWKLDRASDTEFYSLVDVTAGNPKAIEMALGFIKRGMLSLEEIVNQLHKASKSVNDVFDHLFSRAWNLLETNARNMLMAMTLFPGTVNKDTLRAVADLQDYFFDTALGQLIDLYLIDINFETTRYAIHPLTRSFAKTKLLQCNTWQKHAEERWVIWYRNLLTDLSNYGPLYDEISNLIGILEWLVAEKRMEDLAWFFQRLRKLLYAEGYWKEFLTIANEVLGWAYETNDCTLYRKTWEKLVDILRRRDIRKLSAKWLKLAQSLADRQGDELLQAEIWLSEGRLWYEIGLDKEKRLLMALEVFNHKSETEKIALSLQIFL